MKTLITGALQLNQEQRELLESQGLEITLHPDERAPVAHPELYEAVVCNGLFLYNPIERFTALRHIQLTSAGYDRVPLDYIRAHGIELHNAAGVYSAPMAEWTLMRLLELFKNAGKLFEKQEVCTWEKDRSWRELGGKTACIVGFGAYGSGVAKRLKAFDVRVIVVNRSKKDSMFVDAFYPLEKLDDALGCADIVILAVALTAETTHLMNAERFAAMKDRAVLLNAARGALVDEKALVAALQNGKLAGAALDVFEIEPLPDNSPLWRQKNLLLSPHNSFVGEGNHERLWQIVIRNFIVGD